MRRRLGLLVVILSSSALGCSLARAQQSVVLNRQSQAAQDPSNSSQQAATPAQDPALPKATPDPKTDSGTNSSKIDSPQPKTDADQTGVQTKRILWVIPNYRSVSANTYLPPQSFKEKFWLATQDSFDYSAFIYEGMVAGIAMAGKSEPTFGQGASGYGLYYAHTFADGTIENYMVEAIVPALTKEDPRYYTLGQGGFFKRTGYAVSRLFITRTDSGKSTFNVSEFVGAGAAQGLAMPITPLEMNGSKPTSGGEARFSRTASAILPKSFGPTSTAPSSTINIKSEAAVVRQILVSLH